MRVSVCLSVSHMPTCFATCKEVKRASPDKMENGKCKRRKGEEEERWKNEMIGEKSRDRTK